METATQSSTCGLQPSVWFLLGTLLFTSVATAMLCGAIMTDHWEHITWDRDKLDNIALKHRNSTTKKQQMDWVIDGHVAKVSVPKVRGHAKSGGEVFLVPMHGGIWTLCVSLSDEHRHMLQQVGLTQIQCINYLDPEFSRGEEGRTNWQYRMQNLSISCSLVCLIIMGSSALVGAFGVFKHQISAVLVTGVMYLLAATFAMFTLTIIHFKRHGTRSPAECVGSSGGGDGDDASMLADGVSGSTVAPGLILDSDFLVARVFNTEWSLDLGWGGVTLCVLTSVLWILLSKIMRYNPLSPQIT